MSAEFVAWDDLRFELNTLTAYIRDVNVTNGWYDDERPFGTDIALLHSEVSEAYEAYRDDGMKATVKYTSEDGYAIVPAGEINDYNWRQQGLIGKPLGVASELADILIRLLDTADRYEVDLAKEVRAKMAYNETRGYKHGGKKE